MDSTEMLDRMFGAAYYDKATDRHVLDVHDASRIALDAARTADPGGLDEERLAEWLHDLDGTQHYVTHDVGYDGDDVEGSECLTGVEGHMDDARDLLARLSDIAPSPTAPATHIWTTDDGHEYEWCRVCLTVRQRNGSSDAKPCKGPARIGLRAPSPTAPERSGLDEARLRDAIVATRTKDDAEFNEHDDDHSSPLWQFDEDVLARQLAAEYRALSEPGS